MITPIKSMTINQIIERQDDLLVSVADIKKIAKNEKKEVLDKLLDEINYEYYDGGYGTYHDVEMIVRMIQELKEQKNET